MDVATIEEHFLALEVISNRIDYCFNILPLIKEGTTDGKSKIISATLGLENEEDTFSVQKVINFLKQLWKKFTGIVKLIWEGVKFMYDAIVRLAKLAYKCIKISDDMNSSSGERISDGFKYSGILKKADKIPLLYAYAFKDERGNVQIESHSFEVLRKELAENRLMESMKTHTDAFIGLLRKADIRDEQDIKELTTEYKAIAQRHNEMMLQGSIETKEYGKGSGVRVLPIYDFPCKAQYIFVLGEQTYEPLAVDFISSALTRDNPDKVNLPAPSREEVRELAITIGRACTAAGESKHTITYLSDRAKSAVSLGDDLINTLDNSRYVGEDYVNDIKYLMRCLRLITINNSKAFKNLITSSNVILSNAFVFVNNAADNLITN